MKSASEVLSSDVFSVSALSGVERTLGAAAQLERAGRCCRVPDSGTHTCCGSAMVLVLVSSASGPRVSGCPREFGDFRPYPVFFYDRKKFILVYAYIKYACMSTYMFVYMYACI